MRTKIFFAVLLPLCLAAPFDDMANHDHSDVSQVKFNQQLRLLFEIMDIDQNRLIDAEELMLICLENDIDIPAAEAERIATLPGFLTMDKFVELLADCPSDKTADILLYLVHTGGNGDRRERILGFLNTWKSQFMEQITQTKNKLFGKGNIGTTVAPITKAPSSTDDAITAAPVANPLACMKLALTGKKTAAMDAINCLKGLKGQPQSTLAPKPTSAPTTPVTSAPTTPVTSASTTPVTSAPTTPVTSASTTSVTAGWTFHSGVGCFHGHGTVQGTKLLDVDLARCIDSCKATLGCDAVMRRKANGEGIGGCWHRHQTDLKSCVTGTPRWDLYKKPSQQSASCSGGATLLSTSPRHDMVLCKDETQQTCQRDFESLCPSGWNLCTHGQFNNRNHGWDYNWVEARAGKPLGAIYCHRDWGDAGHYGIDSNPVGLLNTDQQLNCGYDSYRPGCDGRASHGRDCNQKEKSALCCAPTKTCGDGEVQEEEDCDDGNKDNMDECLDTCTWKYPGRHGVSGCP